MCCLRGVVVYVGGAIRIAHYDGVYTDICAVVTRNVADICGMVGVLLLSVFFVLSELALRVLPVLMVVVWFSTVDVIVDVSGVVHTAVMPDGVGVGVVGECVCDAVVWWVGYCYGTCMPLMFVL